MASNAPDFYLDVEGLGPDGLLPDEAIAALAELLVTLAMDDDQDT